MLDSAVISILAERARSCRLRIVHAYWQRSWLERAGSLSMGDAESESAAEPRIFLKERHMLTNIAYHRL
jgi:hypothetical protein